MPQGCPNGAQGYHNGAPRSLQIHKKPPKCSPRMTEWTPGCHNGAPRMTKRSPKVTQSAKKTQQDLPKCHSDTKMWPEVAKKRYTDISTYILQDPWYFFQGSAAVLRTSIYEYIYIYIYCGFWLTDWQTMTAEGPTLGSP